jgi:hypothetical protein
MKAKLGSHSIAWNITLGVVFISIALVALVVVWSSYWAGSLARDGYRLTVKIVSHEKSGGEGPRYTVLVRTEITDNRGNVWNNRYESLAPRPVGTIDSFYLLDGTAVIRSDETGIPDDMVYIWLLPLIGCGLLVVLIVLVLLLMKYSSTLLVACMLFVTLLAVSVISAGPFSRMLRIREYVKDQRINNYNREHGPSPAERAERSAR